MFAAEECKRDREIVLTAVGRNPRALEYAAEECKKDREIVLTAVRLNGCALQFAAEGLKGDPDIAQAAVASTESALDYVAEALLLDDTFAAEVKARCHILRINMLSGRYTHVVLPKESHHTMRHVLDICWPCLELDYRCSHSLVSGDEMVPAGAKVQDWPGIMPCGEVSEYQLVVGRTQQA
eukprot:787629-Amphidinium_carterae.1